MQACDFSFLTEELPRSATVDGITYAADYSVAAVLSVILRRDTDALHHAFYKSLRLFPDSKDAPEEVNLQLAEIADGVIEGYPTFGKAKKSGEPPTLDWYQDGPALISSFRSVYGMSLAEVRALHWWEFLCLLSWLPSENNALGDVRRIRSTKPSPKASAEEKTRLTRAKQAVAIQIRPGDAEAVGRYF